MAAKDRSSTEQSTNMPIGAARLPRPRRILPSIPNWRADCRSCPVRACGPRNLM